MDRPTNHEIEKAIDVIDRLRRHVEETEPHAVLTLDRLRTAMSELTANLSEQA